MKTKKIKIEILIIDFLEGLIQYTSEDYPKSGLYLVNNSAYVYVNKEGGYVYGLDNKDETERIFSAILNNSEKSKEI